MLVYYLGLLEPYFSWTRQIQDFENCMRFVCLFFCCENNFFFGDDSCFAVLPPRFPALGVRFLPPWPQLGDIFQNLYKVKSCPVSSNTKQFRRLYGDKSIAPSVNKMKSVWLLRGLSLNINGGDWWTKIVVVVPIRPFTNGHDSPPGRLHFHKNIFTSSPSAGSSARATISWTHDSNWEFWSIGTPSLPPTVSWFVLAPSLSQTENK